MYVFLTEIPPRKGDGGGRKRRGGSRVTLYAPLDFSSDVRDRDKPETITSPNVLLWYPARAPKEPEAAAITACPPGLRNSKAPKVRRTFPAVAMAVHGRSTP